MNKQSAFINEESDEKIVKENEEEKLKELKRKRNCERQRAYYHRRKDLKKNEKKIRKKKGTVPKSNAERQRKFRQRHAKKLKRQKLDSNEENVVQWRAVENIENVTLQENQFHSLQLLYEQRNGCTTPEVILHRNTGIPGDDKPEHVKKAALELDKFKRRLIRAVARLLVKEKKPEEEIWKELKKETGCDCELLWARMRALTVKKLNRLFLANDRSDAVPAPARMSLTDWLMFDLVLVHQKIDLIGQNKSGENKEDPPVLVELFQVVKIFNIENLTGNNLAEAWSLATLYYNNQGHQCSPMLLQRRWYQLREATRFKFYDFWYAYRGNTTRINHAEPFRPTPLQTDIAKTFKSLITQSFLEWEEMIEQGLVTLPEDFERKMKEKAARRKPPVRKPSIDVPDLVMIEPRIDTIDLRLEPDDNATEQDKQEEELLVPPVRIKQEPRDDMEVDETPPEPPKKSIFEVVLESTDLENLQIDSMDAEEYGNQIDDENNDNQIDDENNDNQIEDNTVGDEEKSVMPQINYHENNDNQIEQIEDNTVGDEEKSVMPQIGCVFGNVTDTSVLANIDKDRTYASIENTGDGNNCDGISEVNADDTNISNETNTGIRETVTLEDAEQKVCGNVTTRNEDAGDRDKSVDGSEKDNDNCDNMDENIAQNNDPVIEVSSDNKDDVCNIEDIQDTVKDPSPIAGDDIPDEINEISDDDYDISDNVDSSNALGRIDEASVVGNVVETSVSGNVDKAGVFGSVETTDVIGGVDVTNDIGSGDKTSVTGNIEDGRQPVSNENIPNIDVLNAQTSSSVTKTVEVIKDVEIIENPSQPLVIIDSDEEDDIVDDLIIIKDVHKTTEENTTIPKSIIDQPMDVDTPEIPEVASTEALTVSEKKMELDVKTEAKFFKFGELPPGIIFADEGIEVKDEGMAYFDEDSQDETDIECNEKDEDTPKIDPKLLMCPVVYTTRLDNMGLFCAQTFNHINDKQLLDAIAKKSKPIKKETVENDTVNNYCDDKIESLTVNDNKKTIECVPTNVNSIDDNSIIVKQEPLNVSETIASQDQIVPIECEPANDDNVISEDSDCSDSVDESLKVKPTSYLLQKPRSRRYNPIQLCKNPDFNTRLKRLSVGFFSSPRNRLLIKSCKPLTIDLSKTFESKLISGTLYLKPPDHNVTTEIIDDSESHSVSVVPSAMPAQSLIDNSKVADILPMLQKCLEASKQPVDVAPTSERNKVINLPDITEIRRINQRLLTAEVTPIQVKNNQPQVPVSIVTSLITPTYSPQQTITSAETVQDSRPAVTEATDIRAPPKLHQIIDDPPAKTSTECTSTSGRCTDLRFFAGFRLRQPMNCGRPPRFVNGKRVFPQKASAWKPRQLRPAIPWLVKNYDPTLNARKLDETLLTLDALNKMLFLLTDKKEPAIVPPKNPKSKVKRKNASQQTNPQRERSKLYQYDDPPNKVAGEEEPVTSEMLVTSKKLNTMCQKPRINIKSATNYPPNKDKSLETGTSEQANIHIMPYSTPQSGQKKIQYCCWARQRMLQLLFRREKIPHHGCSRICQCCCRNLLRDYILQDEKMRRNELQIIKPPKGNTGNVTLLREGRRLSLNTFRDVENPMEKAFRQGCAELTAQAPGVPTVEVPLVEAVQVSGVESVVVPEGIPVIDVEDSNTEVNTNDNELIEEAVNVQDDVPSPGVEVSVTTTAVVPPLVGRGPVIPIKARRKFVAVPILDNHNFTSVVTAEAGTPAYQYTCIRSDNQSKGVVLNAITTPNTTITSNILSPPNLSNMLAVKKSKATIAPKTNMSQRPPLIKPFEPPKHNIREKMIFLNSKQISEKPTACPLHLGKNKILLTTIKFPFNLKLFHEAKKALKSSLHLPTGVHIILLADGTVSYKIDPNVEVNATDMKEMPEKIAAVRAHMDTAAAKEQALNKLNVPPTPAVTGEVVDLVDDDDATAPNVNENDKETPLVANVQTTEENEPVNIDGSPNVCNNSQMDTSNEIEENHTDSSISTNAIATESNQNVDQNTVIDIQENIQESIQNEILSASTGQLQDQPDPSSLHVSAQLDLAKTSNQIESSHVREVLTEQAEEQSETSGQKTTIEVQDLPEPATQKISTEVTENSTSEPSKAKSKNILSDLMEMSGIFDEDTTPENEQLVVPAPEVVNPPAQGTVLPPANLPICQGTNILRPMLISTALNRANPVAPKIQSAVGELTAITSLYELKYACANKGVFFKLDMETGYLVPINVCMKGAIKPMQPLTMPILQNIAPKSVIDLTEDDDIPKQQSTDTSPDTSPSKKSLLLVNNSSTDDSAAGSVSKPSGFTGPARPVKLFKALKPTILQRLNLNKINQNSKNFNSIALDHKRKRKQFLRKINLNADSDAVLDCPKIDSPVLMRPYLKKFTMERELMSTSKAKTKADNEPTATTSRTDPNKKFATTILSDDSSDDEPLAKIAKKMHENKNASKSVTKEIELDLPVADSHKDLGREAPVRDIESELSVADIENGTMNDDNNDKQVPVDKQNESEVPANVVEHYYMGYDSNSLANELPTSDTATETLYMSDADNDFIDPEAPFGFDASESSGEDDDHCILGV